MKSFLTTIALLFVFALLMALGARYYLGHNNQPQSFTEGVESLKTNKNILSKIGTYRSHSWKEAALPEETDNPASFKVAIQGTDAKLYLTCKVRKDESGSWKLVNIKQDSIRQDTSH